MTVVESKKLLKDAKKYREQTRKTTTAKSAQKFLQSAGILNKNGKLSKNYR